MASWFGWLAVAALLWAAALPLGFRVRNKRRAAPDSPTVRAHVIAGSATAAIAFLHTFMILPELGSSEAIGSDGALAAGGLAAFVVLAHVGIGLQLRDVRLRDRIRKRRMHVITALTILVSVSAHVALLRAPH
jgi:hypothetical protein